MTRAGRVLVGAGLLAAGYGVLRQRALRWGASEVELAAVLPGDDVLPEPDLVATRGITIHAEPGAVWPWIAQIGWGRGGFYSYDALENLVGLRIHSAEEVVEQWQDVRVGDVVHLAEPVALDVVVADPGRALVLAGVTPAGEPAPAPYDYTWAFALRAGNEAGTTRLVVRERYVARSAAGRAVVEAVAALSTVMSERMLRGVRDRVERAS
jgi:hypothetical protein